MKTIYKSIMLAALAATAFTSCSIREMGAPEVPANRIAVTVNASFAGTKTVFGAPAEGIIPVSWEATDSLFIYEYLNGTTGSQYQPAKVASLENDGANAKFTVSLVEAAATTYDYFALYPFSAYRKPNKAFNQVFDYAWPVDTQCPTSTGPDKEKGLMMAFAKGLSAQPTELTLQFKHISGYGKVSIKDVKLAASESIEFVELTFPDHETGGRYNYYAADTVTYQAGTASNILLSTEKIDTKSGSFDIWFATKPFTFKAGEKATVKVKTNKRNFTKEITAPSDLSFEAGVATAFAVDMSTAEAPAVYEADTELVFDFSACKTLLPTWPTSVGTEPYDAVYPINGTDYTFHNFKSYCTYDSKVSMDQLTLEKTGYVGLPAIEGARLLSVTVTLARATKSFIASLNSDVTAESVVVGGEQQLMSTPGDYVFNISYPELGKRYYIYGVGPLPINKITLYYDKDGEAPAGDSIEASIETPYAADLKNSWAEGDAIGVIDQIATNPFVATAAGASVQFTGTLSEGAAKYAAIYPYNEGMGINTSNALVISNAKLCPAIQTVADGSNLPLYATFVDAGQKLAFKPLAAAIKFTLGSEYDGKFSSIKVSDPAGAAHMATDAVINVNLDTGNAACNSVAASVTYAPESGIITAGTYYLGIYAGNAVKSQYSLPEGLTFTFNLLSGQTAELTVPGDLTGGSTVQLGAIFDMGTLSPELPGMATYNPYSYPADPAPAFNPIPNFLYNKTAVSTVENAEIVDGVVVLKGVDGVSTAGARIGAYSSDGTAKTPKGMAGANTFGNTYFTSVGWLANDYLLYEIPVSQTIKGDVAFSFNLSCGTAGVFAGKWTAAWSKDNSNWTSIEKFYDWTGENNGSFCIDGEKGKRLTYNNGVTTAKLNIPEDKQLQSGDKLYVKFTLDTDATNQTTTLRMNGGSLVYAWPVNSDFSGDPNVILYQNFASLCKCSHDVLGVFNGDYYTEKLSVPAIEGWEFAYCHERISHVLVNGNATTTGYIQTPALTALTAPTDIIVTFKASSVEAPDVNVAVVGAGTVDPDGPFWTKTLADSPYNWTICYVKISGADATTQVKITSNANLDVDDIVITK